MKNIVFQSVVSLIGFSSCLFAAGVAVDTGQTVCYNEAGTVISCPNPGMALAQDGTYQSGTRQGFAVLNLVGVSSVTVASHTGLIWITNPVDAGIGGGYSWVNAIAACENLNYSGYGDWRLPNVRELMSLVNRQNQNPAVGVAYFMNTQNGYYWSSTTYVAGDTLAWYVDFSVGNVNATPKTYLGWVRCVRGGL